MTRWTHWTRRLNWKKMWHMHHLNGINDKETPEQKDKILTCYFCTVYLNQVLCVYLFRRFKMCKLCVCGIATTLHRYMNLLYLVVFFCNTAAKLEID